MITYPTNKLQKVLLGGGCEQRNLPSGYTQVEYLESSGMQYIDTNYVPLIGDAITVEYKHTVLPTVGHGSQALFSAGTGTYQLIALGSIIDNTINGFWFKYFAAGVAEKLNYNPVINVWYKLQITNSGLATINDNSAISTPEQELDGNDTNMFIFCRRNGESPFLGAIRGFTVSRNGSNVLNLIPARRNSDNVLGMYDTVTGNFLTNQGTGTFTAGPDVVPSPDAPMDIVCNNGVLKAGKNLFGGNYETIENQYIDTDGNYKTANTVDTCRYFKVIPSTTYTISGKTTRNGGMRIAEYTSNKTFIIRNAYLPVPDSDLNPKITITTTATTEYLAISIDKEIYDIQVERGSTATPYHPYGQIYTDGTQEIITDNLGNTANAETLLSVGDYKDTQSVLDGKVTRNIGIYVFDGTEYISKSNNRYFYSPPNISNVGNTRSSNVLSTHFSNSTAGRLGDIFQYTMQLYMYADMNVYTTITQFQQWLADQYNAGTPVIIVYPLATPTTEQVTPQPLAGNSVTQTAGSINNLPIESSTIAELKKRYIGDNEVNKVYIGDNLVYEK